MRKIVFHLKSFRAQILLAFFVMLLLIIIWYVFNGQIENKSKRLSQFNYNAYKVSKDFSNNIKNFQSFLLFGYKDNEFYETKKQRDIDNYINNLKQQKFRIKEIFNESEALNIDLNKSMRKLSKDVDSLYENALVFKNLAYSRGFNNFGIVGEIRDKEFLLETDSDLDKLILLQLHRQEKDYLLRTDESHINKFKVLIDSVVAFQDLDFKTKQLLVGYKRDVDELVKMSSNLGFSQHQGLYGKINYLNEFIEDSFLQIANQSKVKVDSLKEKLLYFQLTLTVAIILLGLFFSLYTSHYFTKDIKALTSDIANYIKSDFKVNGSSSEISNTSHIEEVSFLLKNYDVLKNKLSKNISSLEETTKKAEQNAEFKAQFLANMSHEIRSPLNGIIGMLNILKTKSLTASQQEHLEIAEYSAEHLLGLVNMILDHSKIEAGKLKLNQNLFALKVELNKLIRLFEFRINDKNLKLLFNYDDRISKISLGDHIRLQQILINLLDNALKFTDAGFVKLEVSLLSRDKNIDIINFKVIDSGIGIETEKSDQLLEAFEQADLTATRKFGGTGLGLTIANQLIQLMGGSSLKITSVEAGGSCFSFQLPLETSSKSINENVKIETVSDVTVDKCLIVEDNLINQKVLGKLLEKIDIHSEVANNGQEGIDMFLNGQYDIIFMDINMPEMDGYEATEFIRKTKKFQSRPIPIIAVTASAFEEDRHRALQRGMDDFITKPIVLKKLQEAIVKQFKLS